MKTDTAATSSSTVSSSTVSKAVSSKSQISSGTGALLRASLASPVSEGVVIGAIGAVGYGIGNAVNYAKKKKTGKEAVADTVQNSLGLGISAGLGIWAAKLVVPLSLTIGAATVLPVATGLGVTFLGKNLWNKAFHKKK